jgi:methionyl-tRNA formyltransferase
MPCPQSWSKRVARRSRHGGDSYQDPQEWKTFRPTKAQLGVTKIQMPLRIVFFGLPLAALLLARDGHAIELCAVCRKDALGLRRATRTFGKSRMLVRPKVNDAALRTRVTSIAPDLVVSWFWTTRLPMEIVDAARLGGIGVHPSLLPRHRGPDPTTWAILSGDEVTGVTVHRIAAEYDTGAILDQEPLTIDPHWNAWDLARALDRPSLRALRRTVKRFSEGEVVPEKPQDERLVTEAPFLDEEACAIRWSWPTDRVLLHIRALSPAPGAWTEISGSLVQVTQAERATRFPSALEPGEGYADEDRAVVRTGDGAIVLLRGEIDGQEASLKDFVRLFFSDAPLLG